MNREDRFIEAAKARLDAEANALDAAASARLASARRQAVNQPSSRTGLPVWPVWGGAAAMAAGLALVVWLSGPSAVAPVAPVMDLELLTAEEQLEFYEDLEFASWLAEEVEGAS